MHLPKQRRKRGVTLTVYGLQKLEAAKAQAELLENAGRRFTLEILSFRTGLNQDTLMKVFDQTTRVDKRTLVRCFRAFNLTLQLSDYHYFDDLTHAPVTQANLLTAYPISIAQVSVAQSE